MPVTVYDGCGIVAFVYWLGKSNICSSHEGSVAFMPVTVWELHICGMGMLSSCICSTPVSVCALKCIPIEPLAQWGKDLTYCTFFCLVNWDRYYPGSPCRGTDLPLGRILYMLTYILCLISSFIFITGAKGDWDFRISDLVKNPDGTDII